MLCLLTIAILCIPVMLFARPFLEKDDHHHQIEE